MVSKKICDFAILNDEYEYRAMTCTTCGLTKAKRFHIRARDLLAGSMEVHIDNEIAVHVAAMMYFMSNHNSLEVDSHF